MERDQTAAAPGSQALVGAAPAHVATCGTATAANAKTWDRKTAAAGKWGQDLETWEGNARTSTNTRRIPGGVWGCCTVAFQLRSCYQVLRGGWGGEGA